MLIALIQAAMSAILLAIAVTWTAYHGLMTEEGMSAGGWLACMLIIAAAAMMTKEAVKDVKKELNK